MRLWSIHPVYLDTKGLVALWREGLLAIHVLRGQTKGYVNHPQLVRCKNHTQPVTAISNYLHGVADEADRRNYTFNRAKLERRATIELITVTSGQLQYETDHLRKKLAVRDVQRFLEYKSLQTFEAHPLLKVTPGEVESWEKSR